LESFGVIYKNVLRLFDELHAEAPGLFIDCTFETAGKLQLMDYAIAQHAEGNWLSNFEEPSPVGPLRVRQMAWWRSPALPASSLVIGNLPMDDPDFEYGLKSLIGTLPIVLGDPRHMPVEKRRIVKNWSEWMLKMQGKYDYMSYRKDLPGFGEPKEGSWDGWQRINFQTGKGGIFGVFRQGASEDTRTVFLKDIIPDKTYRIRLAPSGDIVFTGNGKDLIMKGFQVKIEKPYDGKIFEVGAE
jgi:alpha-galactosidase